MARVPPRQLVLDLALAPRYGADDYLVTASIAPAHDLVMGWPRWPGPALLLCGPEGAGKSHLAAVWAENAAADVYAASELDMASLDAAAGGSRFVVENIDAADVSETALFHLLNLARERPFSVLLTSRRGPDATWPRLKDLSSRLRALPVARIAPPDDALVRAVLVKLFDDRQLIVDEGVVDYIARRIERSIGAARHVVGNIDRESLAANRRITRAVAAAVLERLETDKDL
ncbi:chromosomal replication initiator protein DnaA [Agaricicola taiwanensis]|uniref:Chromosomal replication initiator protein DnaA n=1 Tax=Agaricicola taiwanensis TaxID=591372 RepID=A0A8J2YHP3_9RHOB|nr:DnaA/Hda family protein [Agaricicola taiwanensis]GGE43188.1 chromosomal replication initiator protein DnaA [Agaricicola taiwanensis]